MDPLRVIVPAPVSKKSRFTVIAKRSRLYGPTFWLLLMKFETSEPRLNWQLIQYSFQFYDIIFYRKLCPVRKFVEKFPILVGFYFELKDIFYGPF